MAAQREQNLTQIKELLVLLSNLFAANQALRHQSANIEVEYFFRDFLSLLYGWQLQNANWSRAQNMDSLDLEDRSIGIAVQVTTTQTPAKIRSTLETFVVNHRSAFKRLIFVYPTFTKSGAKADFTKAQQNFPFDAKRDRLDLGDLLAEIQNLKIDAQDAVTQFLQKELAPLTKGLQMQVEKNVETIIAIIQHISKTDADPLANEELKPDAVAKLQRFQAHAAFLKRQFTDFVGCYLATEAARQAVGYDTARAKRCSAWLKNHSLSALEKYGDDARQAFDALVQHFDKQQRQLNQQPDENAIRYFLADEFLRCNVFPNPS